MMTLKQAKEEAPWHANRAETYDFMNTIKVFSNLTTKKILVIVKNNFDFQGITCNSIVYVWALVQSGDLYFHALIDTWAFDIWGNNDQS